MKLFKYLLFFIFTASISFSQQISKDVQNALNVINENELKPHVSFLSDDIFEGRHTGSRGNDLVALYIACQFEAVGLKPGNGASYFQPLTLTGIQMDHNMTLHAEGKNGKTDFKYYTEFIGFCGKKINEISIKDAELVFIGYGIAAPEFNWNDFKNYDVKGKILLVMNNDPADDPNMFEGKRRMYYGRWDYKYEKAAEMGALGAIVIHTNESASYGWQVIQSSWSNEGFDLKNNKAVKMSLEGWLTDEASKKICALGGYNLDELRKSAEKRDFKPVPLAVKISLDMKCRTREVDTKNVIGIISGSDNKLKDQYIIYSSHYDHLGIGQPVKGDSIYNGAFDNATGISSIITVAKAFTTLKERPKRSIIFIATAAEEDGTLGSQYYSQNPTVPAKNIIANINVDAINIFGIPKNVSLIGGKLSDLYTTIEGEAKKINLSVIDDPDPNSGSYYRSDQFWFAKIGIPSVYIGNGDEYEGKPKEWSKKIESGYEENNYHQPSDEIKEWWDFKGMAKNTQLFFVAGLRIANDSKTPKWKKGSEFDPERK